MEKCCLHASSFIFYRIIIKVAGNQDRNKSSDEFDFGSDQTTHFGVTCPWLTKILHFRTWISLRPVGQSWSNFMCSISGGGERLHKVWGRLDQNSGVHGNRKPHWLIMGKMVYPPFLFGKIGPLTTELAALERLKNPTDLQWKNWVSMLACSFLIESSSKLLVTRTGIKARSSSILGGIRRLILELLALEW